MASREETVEMIRVMQAYTEGKEIENRGRAMNHWVPMKCDPVWNWDTQDYRIKPEPRERWIIDKPHCSWTFKTREEAVNNLYGGDESDIIHVREVLEGDNP